MITNNSFKWKQFKTEIILLNIRWYLKYALSFKDAVGAKKKENNTFNSCNTLFTFNFL